MANDMNKGQREQATQSTASSATQQSKAATSGSQSSRTESAAPAAGTDRERPIQSGREGARDGERSGTSLARHRGGANGPLAVMQRMAEDMDRLFEQFGFGRGVGLASRFGSLGSLFDDDAWSDRGTRALNTAWTPQVETLRRGDSLVIRADIPGVKKDDVHVEIENDMLTISGERKEEREEDREGYYRSERSYGQFYRAIPLPDGVNVDKCEASFKDGVLEVTLPAPKEDARRAKRIQIK